MRMLAGSIPCGCTLVYICKCCLYSCPNSIPSMSHAACTHFSRRGTKVPSTIGIRHKQIPHHHNNHLLLCFHLASVTALRQKSLRS